MTDTRANGLAADWHSAPALEQLAERLAAHARDFDLSESEPNVPGNVAYDLRHAAAAIPMLLMNLRHKD